MAPKRTRTRLVDRSEYGGRWCNALDRREAMERGLAAGALDPTCVLAGQAAIAACDAFTIFHPGERSAADRHQDALVVYLRVRTVKGADEAAKHLQRLLDAKGDLESSGRSPKPKDAEGIAVHARRFIDFVS